MKQIFYLHMVYYSSWLKLDYILLIISKTINDIGCKYSKNKG
jgi:hypothetical protein